MRELNDVIGEICDHYLNEENYKMGKLSKKIGISKRCLQKWKSEDIRPNCGSMELLYDFLKKNNGEVYISRLKRLPMNIQPKEPDTTITFPPGFDKQDQEFMQETFWKQKDLDFLCILMICKDEMKALDKLMPAARLVEKAAYLSTWEKKLGEINKIYGFSSIDEWKDEIIPVMEAVEEFNMIGQKALNTLINYYLKADSKISSVNVIADVKKIAVKIPGDGVKINEHDKSVLYNNDYFSDTAFGRFTNNLFTITEDILFLKEAGKDLIRWEEV